MSLFAATSPDWSRIQARSQKQAMDWSLVLASQGIECAISRDEDTGAWELAVPSGSSEAAYKSLRLYQAENRHWGLRQLNNAAPLRFDFAALLWGFLLVCFVLAQTKYDGLRFGVMDSTRVMAGEWWRVFTAMQLHADYVHITANLTLGVLLMGLALGRFGRGIGFLAAYLAGAAGNVLSLLLNAKPFVGLGASGMITGCLGLLAAQTIDIKRLGKHPLHNVVGGVAAGIMLFILIGLNPGSDVAAHLGGFIAGLAIGFSLLQFPDWLISSKNISIWGTTLFISIMIATWALAILTPR